MGHNIWFLISLMIMVFVAPFGAINPLIAFGAVVVAGIFFVVWLFREDQEQKSLTNKTNDVIINVSNERGKTYVD